MLFAGYFYHSTHPVLQHLGGLQLWLAQRSHGRDQPTGRPASASGARASRLSKAADFPAFDYSGFAAAAAAAARGASSHGVTWPVAVNTPRKVDTTTFFGLVERAFKLADVVAAWRSRLQKRIGGWSLESEKRRFKKVRMSQSLVLVVSRSFAGTANS